MTLLTQVKLGLVLLAIIAWGLGARNDDATLRWIGIGLLATTFALRFLTPKSERRRRRRGSTSDDE